MRNRYRNVLLLGAAATFLTCNVAIADDPLLPEGVEPPAKGRELILPPILNDAPPGTEIVLPPPGQEALLGAPVARDAKSQTAKTDVRVEDSDPIHEPPKGDALADAHAQSGSTGTKIPEQALIVPEEPIRQAAAAPAEAKPVAKKNARVAAPAKPRPKPALTAKPEEPKVQVASSQITPTQSLLGEDPLSGMGGPELSGPPKPSDGMKEPPKPIRDGDALTAKQADALIPEAPAAKPAAPAIDTYRLAQATRDPMPVTPPKSSAQAGMENPDWGYEVSIAGGYGSVDSHDQSYLGTAPAIGGGGGEYGGGETGGTMARLAAVPAIPGGTLGAIRTQDDDDTFTYAAAMKRNLTGIVEPLGGGDNVEPYLKILVAGYEADFDNGTASFTPPAGQDLVAPGVVSGGNAQFAGGAASSVTGRSNQKTLRGEILYGQTWKSRGLNVSGFGGIGHTRREYRNSLSFLASGALVGGPASATGYAGLYDTDIDSHTTSFVLGAGVTVPLTADERLKADAAIRGSYDITMARGRDALAVSSAGAGGALIRATQTRVTKTAESFGYGAEAGISYQVARDIQLRLGAEYTSQESVPVLVRDGANPSHIALEREDVIVGTLSATFKF